MTKIFIWFFRRKNIKTNFTSSLLKSWFESQITILDQETSREIHRRQGAEEEGLKQDKSKKTNSPSVTPETGRSGGLVTNQGMLGSRGQLNDSVSAGALLHENTRLGFLDTLIFQEEQILWRNFFKKNSNMGNHFFFFFKSSVATFKLWQVV